MVNSSRTALCSVIAITVAMTTTAAAHAQTASTEGARDEIVVTANKRSQKITDVGLAVQALSGEMLAVRRVASLADVAAAVPGLSFTQTSQSTPVYTLRGVGFYESSLPNYPSVSTYVDEVPLAFPAMTTRAIFDLERVEVLKGPQGTLFGQNATAGAINLIAAKPTKEFAAGAEIGYGNYNRFEGSAYVSGPLTDTLKARLAVTGVDSDGWQRSYTRDDRLGKTRYIAGRLSLDWAATEGLRIQTTLNGWRDRSEPQAPQLLAILPQSPATIEPALQNYPFPPRTPTAADWTPTTRPYADNRFLQGAVRISWDIFSDVTLTSISSYADYRQKQRVERDGTALRVDDLNLDKGSIRSFGQELRLANAATASLRWVVGANYEHSNVSELAYTTFVDISTQPIFGYSGGRSSTDQQLRNYAGFGNVEWDVARRVTLKGGLRYTQANRRASVCTADPGDGSFAAVFDSLANAIQFGFVPVPGFTPTGVPVPPIGSGCAALDNVTSDGTPVTYLPGRFNTKINQNNLSWRIGIDFKPRRNMILYANVAKGYKAGSIPLASAATFAQYQSVTQESLLSYEAGVKFQTDDHRLNVSSALFYYDYTDKQLRGKIIDPIFGLLDALKNVPKSTLKGAELEISYRAPWGLSASLNGLFIDSRIDKFSDFSASGQLTNFAGAKIPYTPRYQATATLDYQWEMGSVRPVIGLTVSGRSKAIANIGGDKGFIPPPSFRSSVPFGRTFDIPGYALLDLRAGFETGPWRVQIWGKNVANKFYVNNVYTQYDTIDRLTGTPATYGITIGRQFR